MSSHPIAPTAAPSRGSASVARRLSESACTTPGLDGFLRRLHSARQSQYTLTERVPLDRLDGWEYDPGQGALVHHSGRFFSVVGLRVEAPEQPEPAWHQPIIDQPEVGLLGFLAKEFDGVLHFLTQLKAEPGNRNGIQLSPTVQATRSNYTGVHGGSRVPYLEFFQETGPHRVIADVRQSEQGDWFLRKRNRNMVVETTRDVSVRDGFVWLTLGQLHQLLGVDDLVNMDSRSVLGCLPVPHGHRSPAVDDGTFRAALLRSSAPDAPTAHSMTDLLSWITDARIRSGLVARQVPLAGLPAWRETDGRISHHSGRYFDVIGVRVEAVGREVGRWCQPMITARADGLLAFLVTRVDGVLHVLMHIRAEPGLTDVAELAPTVQCFPHDHAQLPPSAQPPFLERVLGAAPDAVRFDTVLSDEGGRFHHTGSRHVVVETKWLRPPADYRWMTLRQLGDLVQHSHYLNMQARSLLACLRSLETEQDSPPGGTR
ncbi:NDP-hexose 2,3-dehydratase family protein [Streptomyces sp. NPDC006645]|uniref:NDP-hexose 2,3-dehydratase family protein n=1 Tax=unclassified Streptomyces TaxID=2593676 RepID=UPI0033A3EE97